MYVVSVVCVFVCPVAPFLLLFTQRGGDPVQLEARAHAAAVGVPARPVGQCNPPTVVVASPAPEQDTPTRVRSGLGVLGAVKSRQGHPARLVEGPPRPAAEVTSGTRTLSLCPV